MRKAIFMIAFFALFSVALVSAADFTSTVCCEKTVGGAFCQNAPASQCAPGFRQVPSSCDSTSFCRAGTCYDSTEGTCLDNTPQLVCENNGGVWSAQRPAQCNLGCCVLGDQASLVSLVRCKKLSSSLGLQTNFDPSVTTEGACVAKVQSQDKGACVYDFEFQKTCKFTTRAECTASTRSLNGSSSTGVFFKDKLCSAEELGTICGPSQKTTCLAGKDGVYFVDTCGNPANIYDASKLTDQEYWTNVHSPSESCLPGASNAGSRTCGNCNYLAGSYCRPGNSDNGRASYGDFICANLNCVDENGNQRLHGESWCSNDGASAADGVSQVGSRFFRRICMNGETVTEPCADYRAEECIEDKIQTNAGTFSQAACRVNRWQDCLAQTDRTACENSDRRDCFWNPNVELVNDTNNGVCLPQNPPGLNFWNSEETRVVCAQGNKQCIVTFKKGLFGGEECVDNCECLDGGWQQQYGAVCGSLGDCGPKVNLLNKKGLSSGLKILINGEEQKQ